MTSGIKFSQKQAIHIIAAGKIALTKPRIHKNQVADLHYLIYVISGTFHVTEDNTQYAVKAGEVFFREKGHHHFSNTYMSPGTSWFWLSFDFEPSLAVTKTELHYTLPKQIAIKDPHDLFQGLEHLIGLHHGNSPYKAPQTCAAFLCILFQILESSLQVHTGNEMIVRRVDKALKDLIFKKFDAYYIADALKLDYSYIGKCYKADTGKTINQHFNALKIQAAIRLMEAGHDNITNISDRLGYSNPFYFSRVFKKYTGVSPSRFAKGLY